MSWIMARSTLVSGTDRALGMEMASRSGETAASTKANGKKIRHMALAG